MIRVTIPTYNRPDKLARLISAISTESAHVYVYDDGSDPPAHSDAATVYRYDGNAGKAYWYVRVADMMEDARDDPDWRFLLWLPDDVELVGTIEHLVDTFEGVRQSDPQAVCLNPLKLSHHPVRQWTDFEPVLKTAHMGEGWNRLVYQTQWMDCAGIVDRRFVDVAIEALRGCTPAHVPDIGTGVGRRISRRLHATGYTMYQVTQTAFTHDDHSSRLTPAGRTDILVT